MNLRSSIASFSARLLRAAIARSVNDLELLSHVDAGMSSARFTNQHLATAKALRSREEVLDYAISAAQSPGFIAEFGVFKGASLNHIAMTLPSEPIYGFDVFSGLPEDWRTGFETGTFAIDPTGLDLRKNCRLFPGLFADTIPGFLEQEARPARLIHVDCDLYSSTQCVLSLLAGRIEPGTVLIFDEYFNYPGWELHEHKAFTEALALMELEPRYLCYNCIGQQLAVALVERGA